MVYIKHFYGGLCNNLLQINNALELFNLLHMKLDYLKIVPKMHNPKYNSRNVTFLFKELEKHYIYPKTNRIFNRCKRIRYSGKTIPRIRIHRNYVLCHDFNAKSTDHIYNYLDILNKQKIIKEKYEDIVNNTIAFHIRRGDYLNYKVYRKFLLSDKFIIDTLNKYIENQVLIFTNPESIDYIKKLTKDFKNIIYSYDLKLNLDEEFLLGSVCNHVITTPNSTFSRLMKNFNIRYMNHKD